MQDFRLHVYDTTLPPRMNGNEVEAHSDSDHDTTMKTLKTIVGVTGNWTITDSHLSPDNERMIYSSIVRICSR
jgi:WD repeat-containing protein 23